MRTASTRQAAAKAKARLGSSGKASSKAPAPKAKASTSTVHIEWRGRRITKFGNARLVHFAPEERWRADILASVAESRVYEIISTVRAL